MKCEKTIIRLMGLMGPLGPIGPMGLMGLIALMVLGCSGDSGESGEGPVPEEPQPVAMGFAAHLAESTKGAMARTTRAAEVGDGELTTALLQEKGFGVYCWYTKSNVFVQGNPISDYATTILMLNQRVTYSGGLWTYTPTKYWPINKDELLTLRAYAPYVSYNLQTDANGMPMLPVVVDDEDYQNGTQHDPLWGTSKHEGTADAEDDDTKNEVYGKHYDNYTHEMSGSLLAQDNRDGVIDWYFHHGMTKLMFTCRVIANPGCNKVVVKGIKITPLYQQGLLDLSSSARTANYPDKPIWAQTGGNMTVDIGAEYLKRSPFEINTNLIPPAETEPDSLLSKGLLIIPRTYTGENKMQITITYSIDSDDTSLDAKAEINNTFYGNTSYLLNLRLTPSTRGLDITMVQAAFTSWKDGGTGSYEPYNW